MKLTEGERERYERWRNRSSVRFRRKVGFPKDLQGILKECSNAKTIMFTVDDAFFYRNFSLSECANLLERRKDVYSVHLKLSSRIDYCHPAQKNVKVPTLHKDSTFMIFDRSEGTMDWNYPWDLAGSVYRTWSVTSLKSQEYHAYHKNITPTPTGTSDVLKMFRVLNSMYDMSACNHPNRLEAAGDKISKQVTTQFMLGLDKKSQCACMCETVMSVITVNCVQDVFKNPTYSNEIELSRLNAMIDRAQLDESRYVDKIFNSVHIGDLHLKWKSPPLVSVLLPVYNGSKYLLEAIQSVLSQTYKHFELIVVDDGSTDSSLEILSEIAKRDERVRVLTSSENCGIVSALNRALSVAKGTFIMRMDSDDICTPQRLEWQVQYLMTHPDISVLGGYVEMFSSSDSSSTKIVRHPTNPALLHFSMFLYCTIVHPSVLMRISVLRKFNGYRSSHNHVEDYDLWLRMLQSPSIRMTNLPRVVLRLRKHEHNISRVRANEQCENALIVSTMPCVYNSVVNSKNLMFACFVDVLVMGRD